MVSPQKHKSHKAPKEPTVYEMLHNKVKSPTKKVQASSKPSAVESGGKSQADKPVKIQAKPL